MAQSIPFLILVICLLPFIHSQDRECKSLADICFVLDSSGSIRDQNEPDGPDNWATMLTFVSNIVRNLAIAPDQIRIGMVVFSDTAELEVGLGAISNREELIQRIEKTGYRGSETNTAGALNVTRRECFGGELDRPRVSNIVVFISDGLPFPERKKETAEEIIRLHSAVDRVISVGITNKISEELLEEVSKAYTGEPILNTDYFLSTDFNYLDALVPNISQEACTECRLVADVCFILDNSYSIGYPDDWNNMLDFVSNIVRDLAIGPDQIRVGLVVFSDNADVEIGLGEISNKTELRKRIGETDHIGELTNTADALSVTRRECFGGEQDRKDVRNVVIFISDGLPTVNQARTDEEITRLHSAVHRVISVGITNNINEELLKKVSKAYSGEAILEADYFFSLNFSVLSDLVPTISQQACVKEDVCYGKLDICFIIDSSGSIRDQNPKDGSLDNWMVILDFINRVIDSFDIGPGLIRVGAVKFSNNARMLFHLDTFTEKGGLQRSISSTSYVGGLTNIPAALRLTRTSCFDRERGDRPNIPNLAIIITDGFPTVDEANTLAEAQRLKTFHDNGRMGVIAIGVTNLINKTTLQQISSPPQLENRTYYSSPDFLSIHGIISSVVREVCNRSIDVPSCDRPTDIAFLLDASEYTSDNLYWQRLQDYMRLATGAYNIGGGVVRAALVLMSDGVQTVFNLNTHSRYAEIELAINLTMNLGQGLNITAGLRSISDDVFTPSGGDLTDVRNIAVVLVAGPATSESQSIKTVAEALRQEGVEVFAVGLTPKVLPQELEDVASEPFVRHIFMASGIITASETLLPLVPATCIDEGLTPMCSQGNVVFVVDTSGSIHEKNFNSVRQFISSLIEDLYAMTKLIRFAVLTYSDQPRVIFELNQYSRSRDMQNAVMKMSYMRGTTNTASALRYTRTMLFTTNNANNTNARNIAIVITDAASDDSQQTLLEARLMRLAGIHVITVGVGDWLDQYELEAMASYPTKENRYHVRDFGSLSSIQSKLGDVLCDNMNECISNPCRNGGTCIEDIGFYLCKCPPKYSGINCEKQCQSAADIAFVLDASRSIGKQNYDLMLDFLTNLVINLDVNNGNSPSDGVRVAMVTYSTNTQILFSLGDHLTKKDLLNALRANYTGGLTNTAEALKVIRESIFTSAAGDRPGVQNIAFVITDGQSINPDATWREAVALRNTGTHILVTGITDSIDIKELQSIASAPIDKNVINITDFRQLPSTLDAISSSLCNNENECEPNPCNGASCTDGLNGYTCGPCPLDRSGAHCERRASGLIDLVFVIDASGSIRRERFPLVLDFVASIIDSLDVHPNRTRVGAVWFSDMAGVEFNLNSYMNHQDIIRAILHIGFRGGRTHTSAAMNLLPDVYIAQNGARDTAARITIVLSDGNSNINKENTVPSAIDVKINTGVHMMVVSVGTDLNRLELEGIASQPANENIFAVESVNDLDNLISIITNSVFDEVNECQSDPCQNGGLCLNSLRRFVCRCRPGFTGISCNRSCSNRFDVAFLLDLSGSVDEEQRLIMEFARRTVYGFDISSGRVRVATIAFANQTIGQFYLNSYEEKEAVLMALSFSNRGGLTNIADALQRTRDDLFTEARGDRSDFPNVAILISDGHSTINEDRVKMEAELTRQAGIDIFVVSVGDDINLQDIKAIASDPDSSFIFNLRNSDEIDSVSDQLLNRLCA